MQANHTDFEAAGVATAHLDPKDRERINKNKVERKKEKDILKTVEHLYSSSPLPTVKS